VKNRPATRTRDVDAETCPKCRALIGEKCRNYKGRGKQACELPLVVQADLTPALPETSVLPVLPAKGQGTLLAAKDGCQLLLFVEAEGAYLGPPPKRRGKR